MISGCFRRQVRRLVVPKEMDANIHHPPRVTVQASSIPGGGRGVFYNEIDHHRYARIRGRSARYCECSDVDGSNDVIRGGPKGAGLLVLCLYPGVYTPSLPLYALVDSQRDRLRPVEDMYLATAIPPSGVDFQDNPFVLNLAPDVGGYVDGLALTRGAGPPSGSRNSYDRRAPNDNAPHRSHDSPIGVRSIGDVDVDLRLDASPSACGHLINHARFGGSGDRNDDAGGGGGEEKSRQAVAANVQVVSFRWMDMLQPGEGTAVLSEWKLPNVLRCDGSPWYVDVATDQIVYFPDGQQEQDSMHHMVAGAAITTLPNREGTMSSVLEHGKELFLDYQLRPPYPKWAADWYRP
jgi:hypothetical protein